jgi:hypothetical protein
MSRAAWFTLLLLCAGGAAAQTQVYRCGADGRSYSQAPCTGGRAVEVADRRSAQQAAHAGQAVQREARQAQEMERARLQAERSAARQGPVLIGWSKGVGVDDSRCAKGAKACKAAEPSKRRKDKTRTVALHRGAGTATR